MDFRDSKILELQDSAIPGVDGTVTFIMLLFREFKIFVFLKV